MANHGTLGNTANSSRTNSGDVQSFTTGDPNALRMVHVITANQNDLVANQAAWRNAATDYSATRRGVILEDGRMVMSDDAESISELRDLTGLSAKLSEAAATEFTLHTVTDTDGSNPRRELAIMVGEGRTEWHQNGRTIVNGLRSAGVDSDTQLTIGYQQPYSSVVPLFEGTLGNHDVDQILLHTDVAIAQALAV